MLQNLRNVGKTWVGKAVAAVLFTLLILSFAVWGIGDIFRGGASTTVVRVGDTEIDAQTVRDAYTRQIRRLSAQLGQPITPEQAQLFGIDQQVLGQIATEAVLSERARELGIRAGDALVARSIADDPTFQAGGQFDANAFRRFLSLAGMSEQMFVFEQARELERRAIVEAVGAGIGAPVAAQEAIHRYDSERRAADYVVLPESLAGEIAEPDETTLESFFSERRSQWRAPEYRAAQVLAISPEAIADPASIEDDAVAARYEDVATARFGTPERRTIQRIPFPSEEEAAAAAARIASGETTFEALAAEREVAPDVLDLGTLARSEILDPAVAEAAFGLEEGAVSEPVAGRFGSSLVRVTAVEPESVQPIDEVDEALRMEIALERATDRIRDVYDAVEDQRAAAIPLSDIAAERGLDLLTIEAVDRQGLGPEGTPVELPARQGLLPALYETGIGVDNLALRTEGGGYVWYDVTAIEPARDRELSEVRDEVVAAWRDEQVAEALTERARTIVEQLEGGATLDDVAAETGLTVARAEGLARGQAAAPLTEPAVTRLFATRVGEPGSAPLGETERVVYRVTEASAPDYLTTTPQAEEIDARMSEFLTQDVLEQYLAYLQTELGAEIDQAAFDAAVRGGAF
ncbi:peptidylprolyl isomerase [Salinarimonas ramus]|uniref:Parvulin-like PPIase n=1 Tax=Salinarimonas ramus TaxID=690164 RepID=A0A917V2Q2_9HYPH|nr:peptidylprolyl isomerase [Salinarimonas ramus]GGK24981.1 peptidylprolyl isomerase [Salinarimonas ramus]